MLATRMFNIETVVAELAHIYNCPLGIRKLHTNRSSALFQCLPFQCAALRQLLDACPERHRRACPEISRKVVAIAHPVVAEDVAVVLEILNDLG